VVLLTKIRAGDREAFASLVTETWDDLVEHLAWIVGSRAGAEDAAQEALIRIWEQRERWHEGSARALAFRIGRNLALDARRSDKVRQRLGVELVESESASPAEGPEERAEWSEYEHRIRAALDALSPGRREVVELIRLRGLSHREAAEALGISQQTVANRMTLALADLRTLLADILPERARRPEGPAAQETRDG
jgi:RNA polymerase sigma-70 factor (ECF subfamily)